MTARWLARVVELLPDPAAEIRLRVEMCRESYRRGHADGWEQGRRALLDELAEAQRVACGPVAAAAVSPGFAVLEARRWGPGGRAGAGEARPGEYRGGPVTW